jgi:hypothetical protein
MFILQAAAYAGKFVTNAFPHPFTHTFAIAVIARRLMAVHFARA